MDKLKFIATTAFYTALAYSAILAYGQYQGFLDIRVYSSQEMAYQARLKTAEAEVARSAYSSDDGRHDVQTAQAEPSVWDAIERPSKKHR